MMVYIMLGKIAPRPSEPSLMRSTIHASAFLSALLRPGFHGSVSRNFSSRSQRRKKFFQVKNFRSNGMPRLECSVP